MMLTTLVALQAHRQEGRHGPERLAPAVEVVSEPVAACDGTTRTGAAAVQAVAPRPPAANGSSGPHPDDPERHYLFTGCGSE
ncbi:MAG: hypothetical protein D6685_16055 [Bacteroidetes bacterium]|nr:MAG: hypothetical protein D6685_16055 [Bacteroidota bacterium]